MPIIDIDIGGKSIVFRETEYRDRDACREIPSSRYKKVAGDETELWRAPLTWRALLMANRIWPNATITNDLREWAWHEYNNRLAPVLAVREMALDPTQSMPVTIEGPYPYQTTGAHFIALSGGATLADDMGTGKCIQTIAALEQYDLYPTLIVCPNQAKATWANEWEKWTSDIAVQVIGGTAGQRRKQIASSADVYIINYESLRTHTKLGGYGSITLSPEEKRLKELNEIDWVAIIADEAHRCVDPHSKQTRALWGVAESVVPRPLCIALTGTPMVNSPDDLYCLLHFESPDEWPSKTRFIDRYCIKEYNAWGGMSVVGLNPYTKQEFYDLITPRFLRRTKAMVNPWLPEKVYERRDIELLPKQRKAYDSFVKDSIAVLDSGTAIATDPLTILTRLTQLASSTVDLDGAGNVRLCEPSSKVDALIDLLQDMGDSPLVVFSQSRQLLVLAEARLTKEGISHGEIWGNQVPIERQSYIDRFQHGDLRVMLCTFGAGSEAITLTAASTICFLQRSWSLVQNRQAEARVDRLGQEAESVVIIDLIASGTVEEQILRATDAKGIMLEEIVRDKETIRRMLS
jgi:SNF2 family DNA or RNA helicase